MKSLKIKLIILLFILKISNDNEITITIRGSGDQRIFCEAFEEIPDEIIVNSNTMTERNKVINLPEEINNVTLKWNENHLTSCRQMFYGSTNIIEIDFSKFDSSEITNMERFFEDCVNLESLDLSNFDTSNVISMHHMFFKCTSLKTVKLTNFNTSKVDDMVSMIELCTQLTSLDLKSFDTSKVKTM